MIFEFKNYLKDIYNFLKGNTLPDIKKIRLKLENKFKKFNNKKILIATSAGGLKPQVIFESALALSLENSGAEVNFLVCDKVLPVCIMNSYFNTSVESIIEKKINKSCDSCFYNSKKQLIAPGFKVHKFSDFIDSKELKEIHQKDFRSMNLKQLRNLELDNIKIGEHAYSGVLRFYAKTKIDDEIRGKELMIEYLKSSLITKVVTDNLFKKFSYSRLILNHGIYVPQGVVIDIAKKNEIRTSTWCPGYRKNSYCITNGDTYHRALIYENNSNWENIKFTPKIDNLITTYLQSRKTGVNDWIHFYKDKPDFNVKNYFDKINLDINKPTIGLATSVLWDAQIDFPSNFYSDQLEWINDTIDFFDKNENLQLIIRISPAEVNITKPARQKVYDEVLKRYKTLPKNIFVIKPEDPISSYEILKKCEYIIIYGSRIGIELAAMGKKIIVCGEGFVRNKNIAIDIKDKKQYLNILTKIANKTIVTEETDVVRAKKYAYHFFFRRMFELKILKERTGKWPNFTYSENIDRLILENKDIVLEKVLESIFNDKDIIIDQIN
jgi:hypothetical protein